MFHLEEAELRFKDVFPLSAFPVRRGEGRLFCMGGLFVPSPARVGGGRRKKTYRQLLPGLGV